MYKKTNSFCKPLRQQLRNMEAARIQLKIMKIKQTCIIKNKETVFANAFAFHLNDLIRKF